MKPAVLKENEIKRFFIIFYIVGLTGLLIPFTFDLFVCLIPWSLLLNIIFLALFHKGSRDLKTFVVFLLIYIISMAVETAGVITAGVFGPYAYGEALGIKVFNTPLLIGMNWLLLTYTTASVVESLRVPVSIKILFSSALMVLYDFVLEKAAPDLDMWSWANNIVPLRNFVVWFALAALFHTLIKVTQIRTKNPLSLIILSSQFVFLTCLAIFLR